MAKKEVTYTLKLDADIKTLEGKLSNIKDLLSGVMGSDKAPKGLEKAFEKIEGLMDKIRTKASQPISSKAGFSAVSKDVESVQIALTGLAKIIGSISSMSESDKLSFLPKETQDQINGIVASLTNYASAMEAATTETAELTAAREKLAKAEEKVNAAQAKVEQRTSDLEAAEKEHEAAKQAIADIEGRRQKLKELKAEQEKIEKFYAAPDENGKKKNRSKKYDGISMRPQDIARQVREMEAAVEGDADALDEWRDKLRASGNDVKSYRDQLATANRALRDSTRDYDELKIKVDTLSAAFEEAKPEAQQAAFEELRTAADALGISLEGIGEAYSEKDANELIQRLLATKSKGFDKLGVSVNNAEKQTDEFGDACTEMRGKIDAGTESLANMQEQAAKRDAFEGKIKQFLGLSGAAQVLRASLRDAMASIKELDATMTEMSVVTDLSVGDYWDQLPEYTARANALGLAINDVYKADTLFYQQGLKTNEVVAISTETMKMARIAGLDTAEATDRMTAALRGFNMELNEVSAQKIADVYSELAAITAADVDEISTAMTKTASIAASAGMEFETTAAFLSQIIETTRESAETAGTAMKTVIARFQELKKSPDEIGEVDGEIVDANQIETALRSVGVSLRDARGQFRELDDVFLELSSKWDSLDKNTQRYIATIAAGSRQQSRFIAMMSDYSRTTELVAAANTSAGASQKQFEKTQESLEYKINQLKNAWHEFTMGIVNSDLVKFGVDLLTKFLEVINKVTGAFDGLGGTILKIGGVISIFKIGKSIFDMIEPKLAELGNKITERMREVGREAGHAMAEGMKESLEMEAPGGGSRGGDEDGGGEKPKGPKTFKDVLVEHGASEEEIANSKIANVTNGKINKVEGGGVVGGISNAGIGVMNAVGVGDFAQAANAGRVKQQARLDLDLAQRDLVGAQEKVSLATQNQDAAKARLAEAQLGLGTDDDARAAAEERYKQNKAAIEGGRIGDYTIHESGAVSKKGVKGFLKADSKEAQDAAKEMKKLKKETDDYEKAQQRVVKAQEDVEESNREVAEANEEVVTAQGEIETASGDIAEASKTQWDSITGGLNKAGQAAAGVGMAFGMVGQAFTDAGLDGVGNVISGIGTAFMTLSTIMQIASTVIGLLKPAFAGAGGAGVSSGVATTAAWGVVGIIVMAVMAAILVTIALILVVLAVIKNSSPEAKLNKAAEAAERAGEAADRAAESYQNLKDSLMSLDESQNALENLRKGTEEWMQAVDELNKSVLDLITQYPELASLVENKGGVLTLDVNSEEVKGILNKYEAKAVSAKGAELGAQIRLAKAQQDVTYSQLGEAAAGSQAMEKVLGFGKWATRIAGITTAAAYGPMGTAVAAIASRFSQDLQENVQEDNRAMTDSVAQALANGDIAGDIDGISAHLEKEFGLAADVADSLAHEMASNVDELREYGQTLEAVNVQEKAMYQAMAQQAMSLIDLGSYSEDAIEQITNVVDGDMVKKYEEELTNEYEGKKNKDQEEELERFMEENYGDVKRVGANKIVYWENGEKKKVSREQIEQEMLAAKATTGAANAMKEVPGALARASMEFEKKVAGAGEAFSKAFLEAEGGALTLEEIAKLENLGLEKDSDGNVSQNIEDAWNALTKEQQNIYGSVEEFQEKIKKTVETAKKGFSDAKILAEKMGIEFNKNLSAEAVEGWSKSLEKISFNNSDPEVLNNSLNEMLSGLDTEDINSVMSQINAIDMTNIDEWKGLKNVFDELNIDIAEDKLNSFIATAIEVSGAIHKIDFANFNKDLNDTYALIKEIRSEGKRQVDEETYNQLIAANQDLKREFVRIGNEFVYTGQSMETLTEALDNNSSILLGQAKEQIRSNLVIANVADAMKMGIENVGEMDNDQLRAYLSEARKNIVKEGGDLSTLGKLGLDNDTDFYNITDSSVLKEYAKAIAAEAGNKVLYENDYADVMRDSQVSTYVWQNSAADNAKLASSDVANADKYQEALILQAIQSGGVSNELISAYKEALKGETAESKQLAADLAKQIAESTDRIVESSEGRDAYADLIERVTEAIEQQRQDEIDKLSSINDTVNDANDKLVNKIQEQIDEARQARANERTEQDLQDLYNQQAYLAATGGSEVDQLALDEQIKEQEEAYQDTLVDQALQNLQDANERAAEQRERQIALMETQLQYQLDNGEIAKEAIGIVNESIKQMNDGINLLETEMGKILWESEGKGLDQIAGEGFASELQTMAANASNYLTGAIADKEEETLKQYQEQAQSAINNGKITDLNSTEGKKAISDAYEEYSTKMGSKAVSKEEFAKGVSGFTGEKDSETFGSQDSIIEMAKKVIKQHKLTEYDEETLGKLKQNYEDAGGKPEDFESALKEEYWDPDLVKENTGAIKVSTAGYNDGKNRLFDLSVLKSDGSLVKEDKKVKTGATASNGTTLSKLWSATADAAGAASDDYHSVVYDDNIYIRKGADGTWRKVVDQGWNWLKAAGEEKPRGIIDSAVSTINEQWKKYYAYETGGLASFTGPAWLDGTKSRPEYVLNADQTERFFSLVDVLENYDKDAKIEKSGDNYFDIEINVEKLESDYDVEQVADKIRRMIYEDASYRNVNAINLIR